MPVILKFTFSKLKHYCPYSLNSLSVKKNHFKENPYNETSAEGASRGPAQRRLERLFNQQDAVSIENGTRGRCRQPNQQPQGSRQHNHDSNLDSRF